MLQMVCNSKLKRRSCSHYKPITRAEGNILQSVAKSPFCCEVISQHFCTVECFSYDDAYLCCKRELEPQDGSQLCSLVKIAWCCENISQPSWVSAKFRRHHFSPARGLPGKVPSARMQSFVVLASNEEEVKSFSINFVDHSLIKEHQLNTNQLRHQLGTNQMAPLPGNECQIDTSCVCQSGYETVEEGLLSVIHLRGEFEVILNIMEATPEDQHSHQGRQDNLNEFRSMRDRMHPPRMSAPSCIVPPTEQLVIRPYLVPLLPTFHGMESENPYAHIKEFEDVCNTFQEGGASIDLMRLKLFPFTLKDKAKIWLNSLRPRSIRSWTDLQAEFLKKFFPTHRTNGLKRQISNFSAKENEKFYECWERYMEAINACPHHGFDTWLLVSYFYDGMSSSMKQLLETMCGGDFMSKNPEEAMDFLSYVADVSRGWDEPTKGEVGNMKSQLNAYNAKAGMYLKEDDDMKAKLAAMTRRLEELELKRIHEVQAVAEAPVQVKLCPNCQSYEHLVEECPAISAEREMYRDQANVVGQFRPNNNAPYGNTYNSKLEESSKFLMEGQSNSIPTAGSTISAIFKEDFLLNLTKIPKPTPKPHVEKEEEIKKGKEMEDKESEISEEKKDSDSTMKAIPEKELLKEEMLKKSTSPPFPQALHGKKGIRNAAEILKS
ncbi:hypothetical protein CK203_065802 [Vitis vinifera]|uniref:Retrotransposon gag domain-containing protein n=1 Tax=Vitis vinifera TaxID=29760 RepID=A0A438G3P7_VITVI|nr:hypothetical protein CK203_065802 [Vitis vinifera]